MNKDAALTDLTRASRAPLRAGAKWQAVVTLPDGTRRVVGVADWPQQAQVAGPPSFEGLVEALRPKTPMPTAPAVSSALRNAELRTLFLEQVGALTSAEVAQVAGNRAKNQHAIASRWRKEGRIFGVPWGESLLFPVFQFHDGVPHPSVATVLTAFAGRAGPWEIALWFALPSPYLQDGSAPLAHLDDPEALVAAVSGDLDLPDF